MSDLSLYKYCLRKIAVNLRKGIYKLCHENPFSVMPSKVINDITASVLDHQRANGFIADDLEQLLKSGKLTELKISDVGEKDLKAILQVLIEVLTVLNSGCKKLEILHLPRFMQSPRAWSASEVSIFGTRLKSLTSQLRSEVSKALENLLSNSSNLKDLHSEFRFDLKALRNCRELRRLALYFEPQQHWYEFLVKEGDCFQTHKCLEFFTVYQHERISIDVPYHDVLIILRHCPEITSLGFIESSWIFSKLYSMGISPSELKLRHCYWIDKENDWIENTSQSPDHDIHLVKAAVQIYPLIEELDIDWCCLRSIPFLKSLRNLVYLNIVLHYKISCEAFNDVLQVIGHQLKHLSFSTSRLMDPSLLLRNCRNLESLQFTGENITGSALHSVSLRSLRRLSLYSLFSGRYFFQLLCDCNQLTELFLTPAKYFSDKTLQKFLERNSLLNLEVACLPNCGLTEHGLRLLLLNAPQLEKLKFSSPNFYRYKIVISETNHKVPNEEDLFLEKKEFFAKRRWDF